MPARKLSLKSTTAIPTVLGSADAKHIGNLPPSPAGKRALAIAAKPVAAKPGKPVSTPIVAPLATETPAVSTPSANISRTERTIAKLATNFGGLSDRDNAYIAFFARIAKRAASGIVTVRDIVADGGRPDYAGSSKPHDAGVIVRLNKAGVLASTADGASFAFTNSGKALSAYASAIGPAAAAKPVSKRVAKRA